MMIGHALFAFAIATLLTGRLGWSERRAIAAGAVAGAFAIVPDVDMAYAVVGAVIALTGGSAGAFEVTHAFWGASTVSHRNVTHSIVLAIPAGVAFGLWVDSGEATIPRRVCAVGVGVAMVALVLSTSGSLAAAVATLFVASGFVVSTLVSRRTGFSPRTVGALATFGLLSHPWGDLFTGEVPALFYPFDATLVAARLTLHPDPTLHLLGAFAIELAVIWVAIFVFAHHTDGRHVIPHTDVGWRAALAGVRSTAGAESQRPVTSIDRDRSSRDVPHTVVAAVDRRASLAVTYAGAAIVLPPPTLDVSYHFVFSILAVGAVCATPALASRRLFEIETDRHCSVLLTALTAVTIALVSYAILYLLG